MKKGLFITFEGPDGAGKTTQIQRLRAWLEGRGHAVVVTREPGGTPIGERIRGILLDPACREMDPVTEALLYAASRAQHVRQVIGPALDAGQVVICDRFLDSSLAYQGAGRGLGEAMVRAINEPAVGGVLPDITVCLWASPALSRSRLATKASLDRLEGEADNFFERVAEGYARLAKADPERILLLDAERNADEISTIIEEKIQAILHARR